MVIGCSRLVAAVRWDNVWLPARGGRPSRKPARAACGAFANCRPQSASRPVRTNRDATAWESQAARGHSAISSAVTSPSSSQRAIGNCTQPRSAESGQVVRLKCAIGKTVQPTPRPAPVIKPTTVARMLTAGLQSATGTGSYCTSRGPLVTGRSPSTIMPSLRATSV